MQIHSFHSDISAQHLLFDHNLLLANGHFCTFRFRRTNNQGDFLTDQYIDSTTAFFFHHLNSRIFRTAYTSRRRTKPKIKLQHLTYCHRHKTNIFLSHIHSIIIRPDKISTDLFLKKIISSWSKTHFGFIGDCTQGVDQRPIHSTDIYNYLFSEQQQYDSFPVCISI